MLFYVSLFLSRLADQVLLFLVPLVVFQSTGSVAWSGLAFTIETLPRFLACPVCGALCDRISPLKLLRISQLYRAATCVVGVLGFVLIGGVAWLVVLSAVCGVLTMQGMMSREVMLPQVFKQHRFEQVLAHALMADQLGMVLGPVVAALMLGVWHWSGVVAATAVLFLLADVAVGLWWRAARPALAPPQPASGHWLQPLQMALRHVWHLPGLKALIVLAAGVNLVIGVTLATSAAMVTGVLQRSASDYALVQTAGAVATVLVLLWVARVHWSLKTLGALSFGLIFAGGALTAQGLHPGVYLLGYLLVVGFDKMFGIYIRSVRQKIIPTQDLGKTTGVIVMLNNLSQPAAGLVVSLFADARQPQAVILVLTLVMGGLGLAVIGAQPMLAWIISRTRG